MGKPAHDLRHLSPKVALRLHPHRCAPDPVANRGRIPHSKPRPHFPQTRTALTAGNIHQQFPTTLDLSIPARYLQLLGRKSYDRPDRTRDLSQSIRRRQGPLLPPRPPAGPLDELLVPDEGLLRDRQSGPPNAARKGAFNERSILCHALRLRARPLSQNALALDFTSPRLRDVRGIATPAVRLGPGHEFGRHRIEMNIAADLQEIAVPIHQERFVALLKEMARAAMPPVKIDCVTRLEGLHQFGEIALGCLHEQMDVIGEQTIAEQLNPFLPTVLSELGEVGVPISIIAKDGLAVIPAGQDMIDGTWIFNAQGARHGSSLQEFIHLFKPDPDQSHRQGETTAGKLGILRGLNRLGPQTVPQMARARPVSRQYIQALVNQLAAEGRIEFVDNPAHKRSRLVRLTPQGKDVVDSAMRREAKFLPRLKIDVPEKDLRTATSVLRAVRAVFERTQWRELLKTAR